jgi:hypothetical protein
VLETYGGLITIADPASLPEGASPRNWDIDFTIGGFQQRAGLYSSIDASVSTDFLYVKTFQQPSGQINTLVEGSNGVLYAENVNCAPGILSPVFDYINPSSYMYSTSLEDREYMCFSQITDPTTNGDVPRQWAGPGPDDNFFDRISQCAPGAPPSFNSSLSAGSVAEITAWSIASNVVTFTAINSFTAGEIVTVSGLTAGSFMNGNTFTVSGVGLSGTQFEVAFINPDTSATEAGIATPQYSYPIMSIVQNSPVFTPQDMVWSDGPGGTNPGYIITCYYAKVDQEPNPDPILTNAFNNNPEGAIVTITGSQFGNGTWQITGMGSDTPPGAGYTRWYFTFTATSSASKDYHGGYTYQLTVATVTATEPIPALNIGDQIQITGASEGGWNDVWAISQALTGYVLSVTSTSMSNFVGKYYYSYVSGGTDGTPPASGALVGQLITVSGTLNGNDIFNVTDASVSTNGVDGGGTYFTVAGFNVSAIPSQTEFDAVASTSGTLFQIDPGIKAVNSTTINPIYGNSSGGYATIVGGNSSQFPLTAGTRQAVCLFVTRNGAVTPASTPVTFNTTADSSYIFANNIPIGPPDTIARIIAITEAGSNGIAGSYFYYIPVPVKSVLNNVTIYYSSTVVQDNITTSAKFTFDDNTLLNATEIDITGLDYFNTIELGNSAWNVSYGDRMFYGLVQNKVYNFVNMSFDGGYVGGTGITPLPLGWGIDVGSNPASGNPSVITAFQISGNIATFQSANVFLPGQSVIINGLSVGTYFNGAAYTVLSGGLSASQFEIDFSGADVGLTSDSGLATPTGDSITLTNPVAYSYGNAYYAKNSTGTTQNVFGMITQTACQDAYQVNILYPQVTYGVRVTCRCPSGVTTGNLIIDFTTSNTATYGYSGYNVGYGVTYDGFVVPNSTMSTTEWKTFNGPIISTPFQNQVPPTLLLRMWQQNIPYGGDCEVKSIEIYPLTQPIGFPDDSVGVIGSYENRPESFDLVTGVIKLSQGNQQQVYGADVFNGIMFFFKENSIVSTSQTTGQEPGNWAVQVVSDRVGACGIYAYDKGKEYDILACRAGVFAFNGGEPNCLNWEIRDLWNYINWDAASTIWVKNDVVNHRLYVGVPLPTPNQWLPNAPINSAPSSPNVILTCNYLGLESFNELVSEAGMHVTMFGMLADLDMRRKWTIWNIPSPNAGFISRQNVIDQPLLICNGNNSGLVYGLSASQLTDNGAAINWDYCSYGFVNPAKTKENPLLGFHRKRYVKMQVTASGQGLLGINLLVDDIVNPLRTFNAWNRPNLTSAELDYVRNLNLAGNRVYVEFSNGGAGTTANISRVILVGNMELHSPMPNIPGR